MEEQYEKKITWMIKNFPSLPSEEICSDNFVVGDSKWRLYAYPKGNKSLSLFLNVADSESLPDGWKRHTKFRLTVVNQTSEKLSKKIVATSRWFDQKHPSFGTQAMLPLTELLDINGGFLVNGEVKIVAEVGVLEVVGKSDVLVETPLVNESIDVNGFQVLSSQVSEKSSLIWFTTYSSMFHLQVESVNNLFKKHPDIASKCHLENPLLRTTYLNSLLNLTEILCQSPKKLSNNDLANAYSTLTCLTKAGFKLDWLEKKLKEVGETRVQDIEEELKDMKQKCADMEALLEFLR
ncbi:putative MATH/TRAF domain-containing protein [Arabidopsis thaliana]